MRVLVVEYFLETRTSKDVFAQPQQYFQRHLRHEWNIWQLHTNLIFCPTMTRYIHLLGALTPEVAMSVSTRSFEISKLNYAHSPSIVITVQAYILSLEIMRRRGLYWWRATVRKRNALGRTRYQVGKSDDRVGQRRCTWPVPTGGTSADDDPEKVILAHADLSFGPSVPATQTHSLAHHPLSLFNGHSCICGARRPE